LKQKTFIIIIAFLAFITFFPSCKSKTPTSPDNSATTGTISGTVTNATTSAAVSGASVTTQPATSAATTGSDGKYTISNVAPGSYTVTALANLYTSSSVNVTVTAGQTATVNLSLQPVTTGTITGTVTAASGGTLISGASVSTSPATSTVSTNAQGVYTITNVNAGSYTVTASATGYVSNSTSVTVTAGQTSTANLTLQSDYSGSWSGTTSQGKDISFTISNNAFTQFMFGWAIGSSYGDLTINYTTPKAISGSTFTISGSVLVMAYPSTIYLNYSVSGTFTSSTTASGTANFYFSGGASGSSSATWSANKT